MGYNSGEYAGLTLYVVPNERRNRPDARLVVAQLAETFNSLWFTVEHAPHPARIPGGSIDVQGARQFVTERLRRKAGLLVVNSPPPGYGEEGLPNPLSEETLVLLEACRDQNAPAGLWFEPQEGPSHIDPGSGRVYLPENALDTFRRTEALLETSVLVLNGFSALAPGIIITNMELPAGSPADNT